MWVQVCSHLINKSLTTTTIREMIKKNFTWKPCINIRVGSTNTMEGHFGPPVLHESKSFEELRITQ